MRGNLEKRNKGITLIALVITIIVLLILAGVTIATLTGENGILTKAQEASIQTRGAQVEELVNLWKSEIEMNENFNGDATVKSEDELLQELLSDKQVYENEIDRENKTITIGNRVISYKTKSQLTDIYVALYNDGTLVFNNKNEFDTNKLAEGWTIENIKGKRYEWINIDEEPWFDTSKIPQWYGSSTVTKISFLDKVVPENIDFWFDNLTNLTTIENMNNLDTSNVTSMSGMFSGCSSLTSINLTGLDTSNVTSMSGMFSGCSSLTSINLTGLDTSNVTSMKSMFSGCSSLTSINLTGLDTSDVSSMESMVYGCSSLTSIDLTGLDTSNVTSMGNMFRVCSSLTTINLTELDTSNVTSMNSTFFECSGLTSINLGQLDTGSVTDMGSMFYGCSGLTNIDVSSFKTSNVINMMNMFRGCSGLLQLDVSDFDITYAKEVDPMSVMYMFESVTCSITISSEWTEQMKSYSRYN